MRGLRDRLNVLEANCSLEEEPLKILDVFIYPGRIDRAEYEGRVWLRAEGEGVQAFHDRVLDEFEKDFPEAFDQDPVLGPTFGLPNQLPGSGGDYDANRIGQKGFGTR